LSVSKDGSVVAIKAVINDRLGDLLEDVFLSGFFGKYMIKRELMIILGV
jgi:hypothetical protein